MVDMVPPVAPVIPPVPVPTVHEKLLGTDAAKLIFGLVTLQIDAVMGEVTIGIG